jgi:hypothetical protein
MTYEIHKLTYSDGRAYRYHISDAAGHLCYVAERASMLRSSRTRLVEFFDPDQNPVGRLQPPDVPPWCRPTRYEVFVGAEAQEPRAAIQERWRLVDILLLRMPGYELQLGKYRYAARGSRYGAHFFEIFRPRSEEDLDKKRTHTPDTEEPGAQGEAHELTEIKVGEIQRPTAGPSYVIETDAAPLRQAPLVLAALAILIDMELFSRGT